MKVAIVSIQILSAVFLSICILLQSKGTGFSRSVSAVSFTRRGLEKTVFKLTFILASVFIITSILSLLS